MSRPYPSTPCAGAGCNCKQYVPGRTAWAYCECDHGCDMHGLKAKDVEPK